MGSAVARAYMSQLIGQSRKKLDVYSGRQKLAGWPKNNNHNLRLRHYTNYQPTILAHRTSGKSVDAIISVSMRGT